MEYIVVFILFSLAFYFLKNMGKDSSVRGGNRSTSPSSKGGSVSERFSGGIPTGYQIYLHQPVLAGVQFRKADAIDFAQGADHSIEFERDPANEHDANAIKVIGISSGRRHHIGFLPAEDAKTIVKRGFESGVIPRLRNIYLSDSGWLNIEYDVLIQKDLMKASKALDLEEPMNKSQKDFLKFFDQPIPKGLNVGQATTIIEEFTAKMNAEHPNKIDEYDAYDEIMWMIDDKEERDQYDLKKPPMSVLKQALGVLLEKGVTYVQIKDDMQLLADEIFKIRPDLEKEY
jgi:hypothetical protein